MRLATVLEDGVPHVALVRDADLLFLPVELGWTSVRAIAAQGPGLLAEIAAWADARSGQAIHRSIAEVRLGPVVPEPGAIYTIGLNYRSDGERPGEGPDRPLVYGKAASSVAGHGASVAWDRSLTANVDAECELGVVIGAQAFEVSVERALDHVFGYTIINDVSSRDPWLDGDQWLIGKSMPGFCPVGPWVVTRDELDPRDLRLGCTVNGRAIQDGRTSRMRFGVAECIAYLSRHVRLMPGDLIATGTPSRLDADPGPPRHLAVGDDVVAWIEGIGELVTAIA